MNGIRSLNAGAYANLPQQDIRLSGDHRPTYTQRRRTQMAGGGIMGSNAGSMLVAPTADGSRPGYGILDKIKNVGKKVVGKIADIIPNEIKDPIAKNPALSAALLAGSTMIPGVGPVVSGALKGVGSGIMGIPGVSSIPGMQTLANLGTAGLSKAGDIRNLIGSGASKLLSPSEWFTGGISGMDDAGLSETWREDLLKPEFLKGLSGEALKQVQRIAAGNAPGIFGLGDYGDALTGTGMDQFNKYVSSLGGQGTTGTRQDINWEWPLAGGAAAGLAQQRYLDKQPPFPGDETGIRFQTGAEAMADPTLRFKPKAEYADVAEGGRIGYRYGGDDDAIQEIWSTLDPDLKADYGTYKRFLDSGDWKDYLRAPRAQGGRIGAQEGGLMNLGGMEKDYRQEGGFVPIGGQEKADDVPARLSKNEFVFTADAVRAAGGGDIDAGAEVMENLMENLEAGGKVSEESQGLEGARGMFANAQQLEKRII